MAKKSTLSKIVSGIVGIVLLGGIIVGSIALAQNVDFRVKQPEEQTQQEKDKDAGGTIIVSDDHTASAMSIKLERLVAPMSSEPVAPESHLSYKITATYEGESTTDKLDLSVAWKNPSSTWATGKNVTDYLQLQHEDGAFEAIATAKQAYGETIVLTGKIRNREITKSINLDYLAKPKSINDNDGVNLNSLSDTFQLKMTDKDYDVGSVKPSKITGTVTLQLDSSIYNELTGKGWTDLQRTKTYDYDILNPTDIEGNIEQFMTRTLSPDELKTFKYDLYWVLYNLGGGGNVFVYTAEFNGNYYAMINNAETLCGQINFENSDCRVDVEALAYEDLQTPLTDFDFGGDILFW